jgi:2-polyprenyl-6-methoxyphenol hydroxylase-like FAD-dependent oxidoreductase
MAGDSALPPRAPVVIVGAGPTGLSLALALTRHGIASVVLEKNEATSKHSKAAGVHVRTREALRRWGVEERFRAAGELVQTLRIVDAGRGRAMAELDFRELDGEADRAGLLMLEQSDTERLLLEAVRASGRATLCFGAEVVHLDPREDGATVTVRETHGETIRERSCQASFVIGCDGASSFVREALGLPFDGITYALSPMIADVQVNDGRDRLAWPRVCNSASGLTVALRLRPRLWRIIRLEPGGSSAEGEVTRGDVEPRVEETLGAGPAEVVWASRFRIHRRASPRFRVGRVLLAGDAAHVHSPIGGQGMNAGVQDAENLAWKLAHALRGGDAERLLSSYEVERRGIVVGRVSRYTDVLTRLFLQAPRLARGAAFFLLRLLLRARPLRRAMLRRMTMIALDAPPSPLVPRGTRAAGVRLPNPLLRAPDGARVRLHDLLPSGPALLALSCHEIAPVAAPVSSVVRIGPGAHVDPSGSLARLLGRTEGFILVRPDGHVAWARHDREGLADAVRDALGWGAEVHASGRVVGAEVHAPRDLLVLR